MWPSTLLAGVIGALLATGVLTVTGLLGARTSTIRTVVQRESSPLLAVTPGSGIVEIADRTRPAVVELRKVGDGAALGAGVVYRSDGWVVTSHQVIEGLPEVAVVLGDGQVQASPVVGRDPETNIAVIKVPRTGMATATLGSVATLKPGQVTVVVGSSLSVGVIAALGREVRVPNGALLLDMIQTDVRVDPASAGGPLVDSTGAVIGVTARLDGGYATPIDVARDVAEQLMATGKVVHAWLGVDGDDMSTSDAAKHGIEGGALVRRVRTGSPAAAVGLRPGDVIVAVDGSTIESMNALKVLLRSRRPGQAVDVTYIRDGAHHRTVATLTPRPTA
jgi:S1-C subfamily serine protease